jgi:hypothetical protein
MNDTSPKRSKTFFNISMAKQLVVPCALATNMGYSGGEFQGPGGFLVNRCIGPFASAP